MRKTKATKPTAARGEILAILLVVGAALVLASSVTAAALKVIVVAAPDDSGRVATYRADNSTDETSVFFEALGNNGRTCATCHSESDGWSITPRNIGKRFSRSNGNDPLFRLVDGAGCPTDDVSTKNARVVAYAPLLNSGLIRRPFEVPFRGQFSVVGVKDPFGCTQHLSPTYRTLSVYRRPLPATNLRFETAIMWDGRDPDLRSQAINAIAQHEQTQSQIATEQIREIVNFEMGSYTAQYTDHAAGGLKDHEASGGPTAVAAVVFNAGINDPLSSNFDPDVFTLYQAWSGAKGDVVQRARASIARGEMIFDTMPISIRGVAGFNDVVGRDPFVGTCSTCHNTPGVGNHSTVTFMDTGVAKLSSSNLPTFTIQCDRGSLAGTTFQVTDPGRALVTGACSDIGKFKVPALRALSARPPYFHNGLANSLLDVIDFYDNRFRIGMSPQQKKDLETFLAAL